MKRLLDDFYIETALYVIGLLAGLLVLSGVILYAIIRLGMALL